jgi:hypothetical protein
MDCTVSKFLPVWQIEQNVISHSSDVCLNPFELHWVRDDEAYAPVRFEAILSTLNFEQNLIPWIIQERPITVGDQLNADDDDLICAFMDNRKKKKKKKKNK